jgi:hypothetical protein
MLQVQQARPNILLVSQNGTYPQLSRVKMGKRLAFSEPGGNDGI